MGKTQQAPTPATATESTMTTAAILAKLEAEALSFEEQLAKLQTSRAAVVNATKTALATAGLSADTVRGEISNKRSKVNDLISEISELEKILSVLDPSSAPVRTRKASNGNRNSFSITATPAGAVTVTASRNGETKTLLDGVVFANGTAAGSAAAKALFAAGWESDTGGAGRGLSTKVLNAYNTANTTANGHT